MINLLHRQERPALFLHLHNCDAQTSLSPALFLSSDIHVQRWFQICVQPKNTKLRAPCISTTLRQHCLDDSTTIACKPPRFFPPGSRIIRHEPEPTGYKTPSARVPTQRSHLLHLRPGPSVAVLALKTNPRARPSLSMKPLTPTSEMGGRTSVKFRFLAGHSRRRWRLGLG